ncbi:MAG: long-chain acyl-CoA synthetase [Deltaproteobacteria bacterium]|nr:long-chain acyl-CoA synthetase [Deltaproteobacteria bacterium]
MKGMSKTLPEMFRRSVDKFPDMPALMGSVKGRYQSITYRQMAEKVRNFGKGLIALGVQDRDHVALLSENRPEWAIADIALAHIGAVNVAVFPTIPTGQAEYIISDSGAKIIVVSDLSQLEKASEIQKRNKHLSIISMETPPDGVKNIMTFDEVMHLGESSAHTDDEFNKRCSNIKPDHWASIIYTSGTTGDPKGAILSHNNFVSNVEAAWDVVHFKPGEVLLSIVPLNHVMGRLADHYLPLSAGSTIAYVESLLRLRQNLREVKPHYMLLVPRVLEMFQEGILASIAKESVKKQKIFNWSRSVGIECCKLIEGKKKIPLLKSLLWMISDIVVFRKIRSRLGLERLKFFFCGGASLSHSTAEFFCSLRINIMEGYGLSETSPLVTVNPSNFLKYGTVGLPIKGIEVKIDGEGEILVRGPNVMQAYYNKPADTAEANGKKVAPQPIENRLSESPFISHAILIGDKQNTITAIIVPDFKTLLDWIKKNRVEIDLHDNTALAKHPEIARLMKGEIERLLPDLADFEKIRKFSITGEELTVDNGALTPTLKVKKRVLLERYKDMIEEMYR